MDKTLTNPDKAKEFVINKTMTRREIDMVRRVMKTARFIPGFPIKLDSAGRAEVEKILQQKEKELEERNKELNSTKTKKGLQEKK